MQRKSESVVDCPREKEKLGAVSIVRLGLGFNVQVGQRGEMSLERWAEER